MATHEQCRISQHYHCDTCATCWETVKKSRQIEEKKKKNVKSSRHLDRIENRLSKDYNRIVVVTFSFSRRRNTDEIFDLGVKDSMFRFIIQSCEFFSTEFVQ